MRYIFSLCLLIGLITGTSVAADIVRDAEYYIIEAQNGERWKTEDKALDAKSAVGSDHICSGFRQRLHRLLHRVTDKAAGIYHHNLSLFYLFYYGKTPRNKVSKDAFTIYPVFGATQIYKPDALHLARPPASKTPALHAASILL